MKTVTVELTNIDSLTALQELERRHIIRIVNKTGTDSFSLPGDPVSEEDFLKWIAYIEKSPALSLTNAKQQWAAQKKKLRKNIR
jgi:hypothetical protein